MLFADDEVEVFRPDYPEHYTSRGHVIYAGYIKDELVNLVIRTEYGGYEHFDISDPTEDYQVRVLH